MLTLILAVSVAVAISFTCSLTEAALYAVPWSAIEKIRNDGRPVGEVLFRLRSNVEKPIAAILTLNTVANTAGSAVAGAAFMAAFGAEYMALFAAGFTVLILAFGEIVPKTLGVAYATSIAVVLARPLEVAVKLLTPVIWLTGLLTRLLTPPSNGPDISEDDIRAVTSLSRQAGQIKAYEEAYIRNILALDQKRVYDIMTPRTVVFSRGHDRRRGLQEPAPVACEPHPRLRRGQRGSGGPGGPPYHPPLPAGRKGRDAAFRDHEAPALRAGEPDPG